LARGVNGDTWVRYDEVCFGDDCIKKSWKLGPSSRRAFFPETLSLFTVDVENDLKKIRVKLQTEKQINKQINT